MAEVSWPSPNYNARAVTDFEYEQIGWLGEPDGVYGLPTDTTVVFGAGTAREVYVRAGKWARVHGHVWYSGSTDITKTIAANGTGSTRIDLVVLRLTRATWDVTVEIVQGTAGAGAPSATTTVNSSTGVYEIPLAQVTVTAGATTISNAQVARANWYLGSPPVIADSATAMPPHRHGRRVFRTDTLGSQISNGGAWGDVVIRADTGWTDRGTQTGWTLSPDGWVKVRKLNEVVFCTFRVYRTATNFSGTGESYMFNLPAAHYPSHIWPIAVDLNNAPTGVSARAQVLTDGTVNLGSLDGVTVDIGDQVSGSFSFPLG